MEVRLEDLQMIIGKLTVEVEMLTAHNLKLQAECDKHGNKNGRKEKAKAETATAAITAD